MTPNRSTRPPRGNGGRHTPGLVAMPGGARRRAGAQRSTAGRCRRPGSVWPLALDDAHPDAGIVPGWLLGAIAKIVALYTTPGQRVLLLAPPDGHRQRRAVWITRPASGSGDRFLTALIDAAQTAARLGRTIEARPARPAPGPRRPQDGWSSRLRSEHRLAPTSADPTPPSTDSTQGTSPTADSADRFDAVITFVHPREADWVADTAWRELLTPNGILAFITHSDYGQGEMIDPSRVLTSSARRVQLALLDHVVLLKVPIRRSALTAPPLPETAGPPTPAETHPEGTCHTRVHADLYLYAAHESSPAGAREASR